MQEIWDYDRRHELSKLVGIEEQNNMAIRQIQGCTSIRYLHAQPQQHHSLQKHPQHKTPKTKPPTTQIASLASHETYASQKQSPIPTASSSHSHSSSQLASHSAHRAPSITPAPAHHPPSIRLLPPPLPAHHPPTHTCTQNGTHSNIAQATPATPVAPPLGEDKGPVTRPQS